jgi:hypothetical protein
MVLDRQYYVPGNIMTIRMRFFDLVRHQLDFSCRVKSYPHLPGAPGEFNYLCLIDYTWGECGDLEFIDLNGDQTQVRFYLPGPFELSEIEEREQVLRQNFSRSRIGLWFYENLGWTPKVIALYAEELYEHKVACLRNIQALVIDRLGMNLYPLSSFQTQPEPQAGISKNQPDWPYQPERISQLQTSNPWTQVGISHNQPDSLKPQVGISQTQSEYPWTQAGISQNRPDHVQPQTWISQVQPEVPQGQSAISEKSVDSPQAQVGVGQDMQAQHLAEGKGVSLSREDQELLRLWSAGLTAKEIGMRTGKTGKTVMNRLSVLRGMYGEERIPLRKKPTRKDLG